MRAAHKGRAGNWKTMATEAPKPESAPDAKPPAAPGKKSGKFMTLGIVGGIMLVEGISIFMVMKFFGAEPDPTQGMEHGIAPTTRPWEESQEIQVAQVRVPNSSGSRTFLYNVRVVIRVHHKDYDKIKEFMESRKNTIEDAIGRVIRSADERHLAEPGLETVKRQIRYELGSLLGDESLIEQVLIPECMPLPTGY
jgi:flagellar basal body-associated protein FliL